MENDSSKIDSILKYLQTLFLIFFLLLFVGCSSQKEVEFSGKTMGTTYHITVVAGFFKNTKDLKNQIDMRLDEIQVVSAQALRLSESERVVWPEGYPRPLKNGCRERLR